MFLYAYLILAHPTLRDASQFHCFILLILTLSGGIGGFAASAEGWPWTIWILLWLSGLALAFLVVFLPETSASAYVYSSSTIQTSPISIPYTDDVNTNPLAPCCRILYRRAVRLRRLTGNPNLRSLGEKEAEHMSMADVAQMTLVRPFVLGFTEPIVAAWNLYIALLYGKWCHIYL
jgi:MFS transporter, DHA1 family, multidrug resistance protein